MSGPGPDAAGLAGALAETDAGRKFAAMMSAAGVDDDEDPTGELLDAAINDALANANGWGEGEREEYLARIGDEEFLPPIFCSTVEEVESSGLGDAFVALMGEGDGTTPPEVLMAAAKKRGNAKFSQGESNTVKNMRFYREAVVEYEQSAGWGARVSPVEDHGGVEYLDGDDDRRYTRTELDGYLSGVHANASLCHLRLRNWGHTRDAARRSAAADPTNIKAHYRLATALASLKDYGGAGDALDAGLALAGQEKNRDFLRLQRSIAGKIRSARSARARRERARAERVSTIKKVWGHCHGSGFQLGRTALVASVDVDDDDGEDGPADGDGGRWNSHYPHSGRVPDVRSKEWPVVFLYPSHRQSDFVDRFAEDDMFAVRMAQMFPHPDDEADAKQSTWDHGGELVCSDLAVYFEAHPCASDAAHDHLHPDDVELLPDKKSAMRFYEAARAMRSDDGVAMAEAVGLVEKRRLHRKRRDWIKRHGNLWARKTAHPCPVVRVHPAATLRDVLSDARHVVPNFLPTFFMLPEKHPAHEIFLKDRKVIGIVEVKKQP
mmetsp:Transcript_20821/g.41652  ORF Transcript_20821/g.41652 Transcript_20821/m.41652 type:complete len:550 (+) Transcript_20821:78-1727(+)